MNIYALEQNIQQLMAREHVPGMALAILQSDEIIYARGFGVTNTEIGGIPVTPETLFRVGSITKPMTATLILRLVMDGVLDLDEPITTYLSDFIFEKNPAYTEKITLRMLLSHTAGLPSGYSQYGWRDKNGLRQYIYTELQTSDFIAPPNTVYSYCNPGVRLAGYIAEVVMERPYIDLMQDYIFDPLAMKHTTFDPAIAMTYPLAQSHDLLDDGSLQVVHRYADNSGGYPSGGVISTILDLLRFGHLFINPEYGNHHTILNEAMCQEAHQKQVSRFMPTQGAYGLGWSLSLYKGHSSAWHEGLISTFGAKLLLIPDEGIGIAIVCNRCFSFWDAMDTIIDQSLADKISPKLLPPAPPKLNAAWSDVYGTYIGHERGIMELREHHEGILCIWNGETHVLQLVDHDLLYQNEPVSLAVGVVEAGTTIMVNGSPCQQIAHIKFQNPSSSWAQYTGIYTGADRLTVNYTHHELTVTSLEYDVTCVCKAIDTQKFVCHLGTLFFEDDQTLVWCGVYRLNKVA